MITSLADIHSTFAGIEQPEWALDRGAAAAQFSASYAEGAIAIKEFLGDALTDAEYAIIERFASLYEAWAKLPAGFRTLLHGDPRVDNVLFEKKVGLKAWVIDWQMTAFGSPQYDLAYFLTGSVDVALRRLHEEQWIEDHWKKLPTEGTGYDLAAATSEFRLQTVAGLAATVSAGRTIQRTDAAAKFLTKLAQRNCAAVADWGALEAIEQAAS